MPNINNKKNNNDPKNKDTTLYGEFISSFDKWITPDRQRKAARHLEEVTGELASKERKRSETEESRSS
ncbi:MAG: hypothetical protein N2489_04025 [Clostridia bacterium]|nr:hypothetical protein [Clostridia bacterium]